MTSYLSQFNYQFMRAGGQAASVADASNPSLRKFIFLHGLMGFGLNWRKIATSLRPQDLALVFDQRGHGKSMKPATGYAPSDYADDVELIVSELGWNQFILVGHSMGGRNALCYASRFPERLTHLVIEDIGPEGRSAAIEFYRQMLASIPTPFASKLAAKEFFMNEFLKLDQGSHPRTLGQYLYANIMENPDGTADWRFSAEAILASVQQGRVRPQWEEFKSLEMPTLVIRGENSTELSRDVFDEMLDLNPRVRGIEISNAGHWVHSDQPAQFVRALLDFVDE